MANGNDRNTLGLSGDEAMDVVGAVEKAFGIKISAAEGRQILTMGDLQDFIARNLNASRGPRRVCLSAITFYRLRQALERCGFPDRVSPRTNLNSLFRQHGRSRTWRRLTYELNLQLPMFVITGLGCAIMCAVVLIGITSAFALHSVLPVFFGLAVVVGLCFVLPRDIPSAYVSMADLARGTLAWNFAATAGRSASHRARPGRRFCAVWPFAGSPRCAFNSGAIEGEADASRTSPIWREGCAWQ